MTDVIIVKNVCVCNFTITLVVCKFSVSSDIDMENWKVYGSVIILGTTDTYMQRNVSGGQYCMDTLPSCHHSCAHKLLPETVAVIM